MFNWLEWFFVLAEIVGTVAFALSGAMIAIDRGLDLFGVFFLGIAAAVGGGVTRDILLGILPPGAFRHPIYVGVAAASALVVFLFAFLRRGTYQHNRLRLDAWINLLDALGLSIFGVIGVEAAISRGFGDNVFLCVFMGMTTGVGGGILRDVFSREVPAVLKKHIYAVAVIAGSAVYCALRRTPLPTPLATAISMAVTLLIRMLSTHYRWNLPSVTLPESRDKKQ